MDTPHGKQPPVMRPIDFGAASSHIAHRPAAMPTQAKAWGLQRKMGVGKPKLI